MRVYEVRRVRRVLGVLLACGAASGAAQQPTFRSNVELVQVDVVVVDRDGNPIRGLKQADFTILDRRKPQAIATFEEIAHDRAADVTIPSLPAVNLDVGDNRTAQASRLVVMVVDDLHIYKERTDRAKEIARKVLADLSPQSSMAVLFTSGQHSTQVTGDRSQLDAAVETLKGRQSWRRPHPAIDAQKGGRIDPEMSPETQLAVMQKTQDAKLQDFFDNVTQYKTLQDAARMLGSGDTRRKAFVLLSEGIGKDLSGLFGAMRPQGDVPQGGLDYATSGDAAATMTIPPTTYHDFALVDMMEAMRRSNVATYAIDPRGLVESKDLAKECFPPPQGIVSDPCVGDSSGLPDWVSPVRQAQHGLEIMSEASGGFAVTNTNDFTSGVKRIVDDLDHYYLIGFYPSDAKGKGYRPIDVRIAGHTDWALHFRRGYLPGGPPAPPKNVDPLVSLSAGILPKTELPLRLSAIPMPAGDGRARVVLALEVSAPLRDLQDADGKVRDTLKYEVLLVDEKKAKVRSVGGLEGRVTLSPAAKGGKPPETVAYQVTHTLDATPGRFEVRVSALSAKLAKGGSVYLDVDVPDFHAAPLALGGLVVGYAGGARVAVAPTVVAGSTRGGRGAQPSASTQALASALPFPPTLDRIFSSSDVLRVYTEGSSRVTGLMASVEIVDTAGKIIASHSPSFTSGAPVRIGATLPMQGLAPGAYLLRVTLAGGGQKAIRETGFAVR